MDENGHASSRLDQRGDVILMRMHAARRQQAHDVQRPAFIYWSLTLSVTLRSLGLVDEVHQHRTRGERPVFNGDIDARQILRHDAAGTDIHVSDFGIAHLAARQAHGRTGGGEQSIGAVGQHARVVGRPRPGDGVVGSILGPPTPAVENAKKRGARNAHDITRLQGLAWFDGRLSPPGPQPARIQSSAGRGAMPANPDQKVRRK